MNNTIETLYTAYLRSRSVTTDSRRIAPGCLFFALKGERFDGNAFARQALEQGAALCVVSDETLRGVEGCLVVDDVLATLQDLARHHRQQLHIPVVGITGTNGKTTTKELVNAVLSRRYRTHATAGNYNNHLGVPLTLLAMPDNTEIAIIEMGANHPGEIDFLCSIAQPTCGLITSVGKAHLEGFGSLEGVVRTKTELYRHLAPKPGATLFYLEDDSILHQQATSLSPKPTLVSYGQHETAMVKGACTGSNPYMNFYFEDNDNVYTVKSQLIGQYNFANAMAAVAVGRTFGVELFDIKEALEQYTPTNNRSQYLATKSNRLILDCYNANPTSMRLALDNFLAMEAPRKLAIVGSMKELGTESATEHAALQQRLRDSGVEHLLVGDEFEGPHFATVELCIDHLKAHPVEDTLVLIKGSNSNRLWLLQELL